MNLLLSPRWLLGHGLCTLLLDFGVFGLHDALLGGGTLGPNLSRLLDVLGNLVLAFFSLFYRLYEGFEMLTFLVFRI